MGHHHIVCAAAVFSAIIIIAKMAQLIDAMSRLVELGAYPDPSSFLPLV